MDYMNEMVKKMLIGAIGNEPDYKIRKTCLYWRTEGVLSNEEMKMIDEQIEKQYIKEIEVDEIEQQ